MPTDEAQAKSPREGTESALQGVNVQNLDPQTAQQLGVPPSTAGVVVTGIDPNSAAADSGLQRGDVIQEVNRKPIKNTSDFSAAMRNSKSDNLLLVNRQGNTLFVTV
jgi:serine protease Do